MSEIRFYIPKDVTIPTDLEIYVGDTHVKYERIHSGFRFRVSEEDASKALEIAKEIAAQMKREHDEPKHGISWRDISWNIVNQEERYKIGTIVDWKYRVRDSY